MQQGRGPESPFEGSGWKGKGTLLGYCSAPLLRCVRRYCEWEQRREGRHMPMRGNLGNNYPLL